MVYNNESRQICTLAREASKFIQISVERLMTTCSEKLDFFRFGLGPSSIIMDWIKSDSTD